MLHPKQNRIDYGEQLIPPDGYELAHAIGTTYSLDLEALMLLPIALFYAKKIEGTTDDLRYDMLDSITKAAEKITIFYHKSQLKVPEKYHHLMAYWEKGIQPVSMPNYASSFHPKVWIVRYESKGDKPIYRFINTSRNLTFSRDWDVAFSTEGAVTNMEQQVNKPLIHFLKYLSRRSKNKIPKSFIEDLLKVKFDLPDKFEELNFYPIGIKDTESGDTYINPLTSNSVKWNNLLIVSPFLDNKTLSSIRQSVYAQPVLCSRREELENINSSVIQRFTPFEFNTYFSNAEFMEELEDDGVIPKAQNLHAKLYVAMLSKVPHWYLGSANCSDPAQKRNIEFLVELKGQNSKGLRTNDLVQMLTDPEKADGAAIFNPYAPGEKESEEDNLKLDQTIRKLKFDLSRITISGKASHMTGGTKFRLELNVDATNLKIPEEFSVMVKPLPEKQKNPVRLEPGVVNIIDHFTDYAETELSVFLIFSIYHQEFNVSEFLLPMEIDLPTTRLNKIFSSIIDSREKFMKYLAFLLTGEETGIIEIDGQVKSTHTAVNGEGGFTLGGSVYEKLLIASSRYPGKLKSIDKLIQRLKTETENLEEPIITDEFESFWSVFKTFIKSR